MMGELFSPCTSLTTACTRDPRNADAAPPANPPASPPTAPRPYRPYNPTKKKEKTKKTKKQRKKFTRVLAREAGSRATVLYLRDAVIDFRHFLRRTVLVHDCVISGR